MVGRGQPDQLVHLGGAPEELQVLARHHATLGVAYKVHLRRAGRREHPVDEGGQLARRVLDGRRRADELLPVLAAIVEGEHAVPGAREAGRQGDELTHRGERAVHQHHRARVFGRGLAGEVVHARELRRR